MSWNRPSNVSQPPPKKPAPSLKRGILAGAIVVLVAGLVAWLFTNGEADSRPLQKNEPSFIKEVKPVAAPKPTTNAAPAEVAQKKPEAPKPLTWLGKKVIRFTAETNAPTGFIVESYVTEDGKLHKHLIEPKKQIFDNVADDAIAMAISTPPGQVMPPMPLYPGFEREFEEALKKPVEFKDDDTPEIRQLKEQVAATRESVKQMMAEGQTIREILTEHQQIWNENAELHNKFQRELSEIVRSGDLECARKYELKMNAALQQMGVPEIRIPDLNKKKRPATEQ